MSTSTDRKHWDLMDYLAGLCIDYLYIPHGLLFCTCELGSPRVTWQSFTHAPRAYSLATYAFHIALSHIVGPELNTASTVHNALLSKSSQKPKIVDAPPARRHSTTISMMEEELIWHRGEPPPTRMRFG